MLKTLSAKKKHYLILLAILIVYFLLTLFRLIKLPVFADEAIYIRWTQLIIDDWRRYLFFPMNDGKTPLQMWLMIPFQFMFTNPLFAGRFLSVLIGAGNVLIIGLIGKEFSKDTKQQQLVQYLAMLMTILSPFTFFHHRMALTDALLFFNLNLSFYFGLKFLKNIKLKYLLLLSLSFFLALFSKLSALLFIPSLLVLFVLFFYSKKFDVKSLGKNILALALALGLGLLLFYSFKRLAVFPQIFSRGGDFLHPLSSLFKIEVINTTFNNLKFFIEQYLQYFALGLLLLAFVFFNKEQRKEQLLLLTSFLAFILPLACMGKIIYPRYLLPASLFLIISAALNLTYLFTQKKLIYRIIGGLLAISILIQSFGFIIPSYFSIDDIPFSRADRAQYLEEWSSGQGIYEVSQLMLESKEKQSLAVATEGYFGTLPDGILMYLHQKNLTNLVVEGIGQPISAIPENFIEKSRNYKNVWLLVNSHRLRIDLDKRYLLHEYCRPNEAPCLQLWDISFLIPKK
ncbi:MAG: hypothetical protein GX559_01925 [Candidatus Pacebacteria bacterium]|nr:hypothetical protein [Candidatus Paceibacterota bacterium]